MNLPRPWVLDCSWLMFDRISMYLPILVLGCFHHLSILLSAGFQIQEAGLQAWETQQSLHDPAQISHAQIIQCTY